MGPTTSRQRPAKDSPERKDAPIRRIRLKVTVPGTPPDRLADLARDSGLEVVRAKGGLSLGFEAATTQEALERIKVLTGLLASKP